MRISSILGLTSLAMLSAFVPSLAGCGSGSDGDGGRTVGQTSFQSAPPAGQSQGGSFGASDAAGAGGSATTAPTTNAGAQATPTRTVQETDIYRLDGNRLYYLNSYRGLMVFDVTNVDAPVLVGRSPVFGYPVDMTVSNGVATMILGDWYGYGDDGSPFYGSVVRTVDATNPAAIRVLGDARVPGWVRDSRVVGHVMYLVSEDENWTYGWYNNSGTSTVQSQTIVTSVNFSATAAPVTVASKKYTGYQGAFNVTANNIVLAHDIPLDPNQPWGQSSGKSSVEFLDISDPNGAINVQASMPVNGSFQGWGTDGGRWNVDYNADTHIAHVLTCGASGDGYYYCGGTGSTMVLSTLDFTTPTAASLASELSIPSSGWSPAARFDTNRLYLSPSDGYYSADNTTPVQIFDLTDPKAPVLAGSTNINGSVWNFTPMGGKIFALGNNDYQSGGNMALQYIDATDAKNPVLLGTASFGQNWGYSPAASTFKAFLLDSADNMVVLPFSSWANNGYQDGLQLIEFTPTSIAAKGASHTKGWVERGILVKNRLVSLSDMALSVVDYTDHMNPKTTAELTLARNVVDARPDGATIAQLSTDWWGYDNTKSELRVLPIADAEEKLTNPSAISVDIDGTNAQVFRNGNLAYVVSDVQQQLADGSSSWTEQVQVVDLSNGGAVPRGKVTLPTVVNSYGYYGGYIGCYWYDWWDQSAVVQVENNALAFRRVQWTYDSNTGKYTGNQTLYVADMSNADAPVVAGAQVTQQNDWWWGNVRAVGNTLYTSHYEWVQDPIWDNTTGKQIQQGIVKYYLDQIDLTDRANPKVGAKINVPGLLVGASETDPSLLYFVDYRWTDNSNYPHNDFSVARISGNTATLQSNTDIQGWTGNVFVKGNTAYMSAETYTPDGPYGSSSQIQLHQLDLSNPSSPKDFTSAAKQGWGWLLGVEGDRAIVTSGWSTGIDLYKLTPNTAPSFDQYARTRGWWSSSVARQDNTLFLSSGYWGVQSITLNP